MRLIQHENKSLSRQTETGRSTKNAAPPVTQEKPRVKILRLSVKWRRRWTSPTLRETSYDVAIAVRSLLIALRTVFCSSEKQRLLRQSDLLFHVSSCAVQDVQSHHQIAFAYRWIRNTLEFGSHAVYFHWFGGKLSMISLPRSLEVYSVPRMQQHSSTYHTVKGIHNIGRMSKLAVLSLR